MLPRKSTVFPFFDFCFFCVDSESKSNTAARLDDLGGNTLGFDSLVILDALESLDGLGVDLLGDNLLGEDLLGEDFDDDIEDLLGEDTESLLLDEMDFDIDDKLLGVTEYDFDSLEDFDDNDTKDDLGATEEVVFGFCDGFDIEIVVGTKVGV